MYNGWTNKDTWEAHVIITNDEDLYNEFLIALKETDYNYLSQIVRSLPLVCDTILDHLKVDLSELMSGEQ